MAAPTKTAADCDLDEVMAQNIAGNPPCTESSNRLIIQRFADLDGILYSSLTREDFSDSNVDLFLHDIYYYYYYYY